MSRTLSTEVAAAVSASEVRPAFFVYLNLESGAVRVWSGVGDFTMGGNVFIGVGALGGISPIEESKRVSARGIELSLSGIPSGYVAMTMTENYRNRKVHVWLGLFTEAMELIADPVQIFGGRIDTMTLQDTGDSSTITLAAENALIDMERASEIRYTDQEQQRLFPGDLGLQYVAGLQNKPINWGVANPTPAASSSRPPSFVRPSFG